MKTDTEQLARLISIPAAPIRAQWQIVDPQGKPTQNSNDWALVAILEYEDSILKQLLETAGNQPSQDVGILPALDWFPTELRQGVAEREDGRLEFSDRQYAPDQFLSSPLLNGYIARIGETNLLLVYLFTT